MVTWNVPLVNDLKLPQLINSTDTFHFRFWTNGQAIDIWSNNYKIFYGQISNFTNTYVSYDMEKQKSKPSKLIFNQTQLDTLLARHAFELIKTVEKIPSQDSIRGWSRGFDGITYLFEVSTPASYTFKNYWTPQAQDSILIAATQIQAFVDTIYSLLNLKKEYDAFFETLPPGSYTNDNYLITTKMSKRQMKKWKRYEKRHPQK